MNIPVSYHHGKFPPGNLDWEALVSSIAEANAAVARYDGLLTAIPNPSVLLSPLTTQEAVLSSRIEGTQATMGDVLSFEAEGESSNALKEADIHEILNYRKALRQAESALETLPLSQRLILDAHRTLLSGVRGQGKSPGEYRRLPNWIGPQGCSIEEAKYIPIEAHFLTAAMGVWEKFIHEEFPDKLVQLAILHAEFEALHPFLDGNGRLGRMFVPLFLYEKSLISSPMFYISAYLEAKRDEYYERLLAVTRDNDWNGWALFFLNAVQQQADENRLKAQGILDLYNNMKTRIVELTHSQFSIHTLEWIFERPIFKASDFIRSAQIPKPTATRILTVLKTNNVLKTLTEGAGSRSAVLAYPELLNLAEGKVVF